MGTLGGGGINGYPGDRGTGIEDMCGVVCSGVESGVPAGGATGMTSLTLAAGQSEFDA